MSFDSAFDPTGFGPLSMLRALGIDPRMLEEQVVRREAQSQYYSDLTDSYQQMQKSLQLAQLMQMMQAGGIPGQGFMPPPAAAACPCPHMYAQQMQSFADASGPMSMESLMMGPQSAMMQEFLRVDPFARQQLEMMLGGRLMPGDIGGLNVMPFMGGMPGAMGPAALLQQAFAQGHMAGTNSAFQSMMLGALLQTMFPPPPKAKKKKKKKHAKGSNQVRRGQVVDALRAMLGGRGGAGGVGGRGGGGGGGGGGFQGGVAGPHQGRFGLGRSNGDDVAGVLNDPSLTVEDKVCLMIMLIMKKMDKDIERQAQEINKLQQQQNGGGGGGGGKGGGAGGAGGSPSIDVETMKLKRLIDKRGQMFDMLRQIIDKYNQTAKGIIDSIGR